MKISRPRRFRGLEVNSPSESACYGQDRGDTNIGGRFFPGAIALHENIGLLLTCTMA